MQMIEVQIAGQRWSGNLFFNMSNLGVQTRSVVHRPALGLRDADDRGRLRVTPSLPAGAAQAKKAYC
jgi:hypothetical protein